MLRIVVALLVLCTSLAAADSYYPPADSAGGWRRPANEGDALRKTGFRVQKLDDAFEWAKLTSQHGGLLVARHGWLVYERYFGRGHREATPNNASIGKSFCSISIGILLRERPDLFPDGLDQKVFTPHYFPAALFPLSDPRKAQIKLGQLLAMTAGIRGNNPCVVKGKEVTIEPAGPDGSLACVDAMAFGKQDGPLNTMSLWCDPGEGYSYATSSPHLASIMLRHITGEELEAFVRKRLAAPLGWGQWGWGYRQQLEHTAGGGGIALRPPDMLRFAYLLLRKGSWKGRQIVPQDFIEKCARSSPYNPHFAYSLQFNVSDTGQFPDLPRDLFWKSGSGGHCIYVVPSLDLVVYKMGGRDAQWDPANTGVPPLRESVFRYDGSRDGWRLGTKVSYTETYAETLRRVLAALSTQKAEHRGAAGDK
ncbi:MAG: beta-lactamase family protein [Acidobacteria bacterium]|nr:beta-lactamase family protein [Acidobacteriota bacterium]